tara:strand:+ start:344 stop:1474 length:1131 start_codon:yes stop_codon:yes gene_type:complete
MAAIALANAAFGSDAATIGREIFLDENLSQPVGQGCVSCHQPKFAFAEPRPVSLGAVAGREGKRNAPTLMYAALIPSLVFGDFFTKDGDAISVWEGGLFHDGRSKDLFDQVQQPFFNPDEMNLEGPAVLAAAIRNSDYTESFRQWVDDDAAWSDDRALLDFAYRALVEFLKEPLFRPFDARIDEFLKGDATALNESEMRGFNTFTGSGMCADCHLLTEASWEEPLLSDFRYDNLGVPSRGEKDAGLGGQTGQLEEMGQFRAPTLRNIELTAPYMHNGSFATLREVIEFYNKRDLDSGRWGPNDYPETVNHKNIGNLGLTDQQVDDLLALMNAFTDRSLLRMKPGDRFPEPPLGTPDTKEKEFLFPGQTYQDHPDFE